MQKNTQKSEQVPIIHKTLSKLMLLLFKFIVFKSILNVEINKRAA